MRQPAAVRRRTGVLSFQCAAEASPVGGLWRTTQMDPAEPNFSKIGRRTEIETRPSRRNRKPSRTYRHRPLVNPSHLNAERMEGRGRCP